MKNSEKDVNVVNPINSNDSLIDEFVNELNSFLNNTIDNEYLRQIALEKLKSDLEESLSIHGDQLDSLSVEEKYSLLKPPYFNELLNKDLTEDIIHDFISSFSSGTIKIPEALANYLANVIDNIDPDWSKENIDPKDPDKWFKNNPPLVNDILFNLGVL